MRAHWLRFCRFARFPPPGRRYFRRPSHHTLFASVATSRHTSMLESISKPAPFSLSPTGPLDWMQVGAVFGQNRLVRVGPEMVWLFCCRAHLSVPRSMRSPVHALPLWILRPLRAHALQPCRGGLTRGATISF